VTTSPTSRAIVHRFFALAEVVRDHDVAAGLDERGQPVRIDAAERIDQEQDVLRGEVAPLELGHGRDLEAHALGERDELRHPVPRGRVRIVVGELGRRVRDTRDQHQQHERALHRISRRNAIAAIRTRSSATSISGGCENASSA